METSYKPDRRYRLGLTALLLIAGAITAICVHASLDWIDRPFNGFLLGRNRIVAPVAQPHWSGPRAGVPYWSQLVAIDGNPVDDVADVLNRAAESGEGRSLRYTFQQDGRETTIPIEIIRFTVADYLSLFANYLFNGLAFLFIGFFVAFLRPQQKAAHAMLAFSLTWGLSLIISIADFASFHFRELLAVAEASAPASLLYLTLCFPTEHPLAKRKAVLGGLAGISVLLAGLNIVLYDRAPNLWIQSYEFGLFWAAVAVVSSVALMWSQYRNAASPIAREKIKIVFLGIIVAFALPATVYAAGQVIGAAVPLNVLPAATWVFPAALAYAIVKRDLFEIDVFLRRAASYVALSAAVLVLYVAAVGFVSQVFHNLQLASSPWFTLIFSLGILAVVRPLRDWLQAVVDRIFFRTHFDYVQITESLSQALTRTLDLNEVTRHVRQALTATMAPTFCRLFHAFDGIAFRSAEAGTSDVVPESSSLRDLSSGRIVDGTGLAAATGSPDLGAALLVPLCFESQIEGLLILGPKNSGAPYGPRDFELLRTLANQTAMALRNVSSYHRVTELLASLETRVEERTRELARSHEELARAYEELRSAQTQLIQAEKMASLGTLVAGVAHEINNPVSFVSSSIDLIATSVADLRDILDRHLQGKDASPEIRALRQDLDYEYRIAMLQQNAAICRDGATRAAQIVNDLRTFCRPGNGRRETADLHATLEQSLRLVQGECKGRVTVHRDYGNLPNVVCDAGQLSQVFVNLLANAIQSIDGKGDVFVRTRSLDGTVTVEIEDTGRGIDESIASRIFDPFFTTKEVGKGTGLGLSIVRSLVSAHGGRIDACSKNGSGTGSIFTLTLPIQGAEHAP